MAYEIDFADGSSAVEKTTTTGYAVSEHGILRLIERNDSEKWIVSAEYPPHAWIRVNGTRFDGNISGTPGTDGKIVNGRYFN
ncbi:hypothetical protein ACFFON_15430 [Arthrobacter citreus]|uniref:hypothetical protein n=1 Tax=Arthrobacter TaxID=1663 RepID=UPI001264E1C8|nr:hypothetical protein [Arthrobacter gandavensis]